MVLKSQADRGRGKGGTCYDWTARRNSLPAGEKREGKRFRQEEKKQDLLISVTNGLGGKKSLAHPTKEKAGFS